MFNYEYNIYIYIYILYKIEILLYSNLSVYVCEAPSWRLEPRSLLPTLHKYKCDESTTKFTN